MCIRDREYPLPGLSSMPCENGAMSSCLNWPRIIKKAPTVKVAITAGVVKRFQKIPRKTATTSGGVNVE